MTTKGNPEKNDTDADGHGQDRVTGTAGQGHATSARDHVTVTATAVDEALYVTNVLCSYCVLWCNVM